jgi:hypothetical protein
MKAVIITTFFILAPMVGSCQKSSSDSDSVVRGGGSSGSHPKIDLAGKLPEDFDWPAFFAGSDQSTGGRAMAALSAHVVLRERIDQICAAQRKFLLERKNQKALDSYNKMQELWEQAANAEIAFVGSEYEGGTEAKVSFAKHRFKVYLRRIRELRDIAATAHFDE